MSLHVLPMHSAVPSRYSDSSSHSKKNFGIFKLPLFEYFASCRSSPCALKNASCALSIQFQNTLFQSEIKCHNSHHPSIFKESSWTVEHLGNRPYSTVTYPRGHHDLTSTTNPPHLLLLLILTKLWTALEILCSSNRIFF